LFYPLERALIESFVKAAIDDEKDTNISSWGESLRAWISMMIAYLDVKMIFSTIVKTSGLLSGLVPVLAERMKPCLGLWIDASPNASAQGRKCRST
jgi:hypothetical protein